MTISAQSIIHRVVGTLQDPTSVRWPISELARWFNDAQRIVVLNRPDAKPTNASVTLVNGTKQTIPADGIKLIEVVRNTNGNAMRLVDREILDAQIPSWHTLTGATALKHFMFDQRDPRVFYVYPPATTSASVDIVYAAAPTDISEPADGGTYASVSGNMDLPDIFASVVYDLLCYFAYTKDAEYAGNAELAQAHYQAAMTALGVEIKATVMVAPTSRGNPNHPAASATGAAA